jgi:hypothetical protein
MLDVRAMMKNPPKLPSVEVRKLMVDKRLGKLKRLNSLLKHPSKLVRESALDQIKGIAYGTEVIDPYAINSRLCVNVARLISVNGKIDWASVSHIE